jgi:SAM-dependent methyltransferase
MPIETISHQGKEYPAFQASGNAARFVIPFAQEVCKGVGVDVGCNRNEWAFPGAIPVDPVLNRLDAYNFPDTPELDYVFSSHCLEHLPDFVKALEYWHTRLRVGGVLFLYLPDYSQTYWRPWSNRKHMHIFTPTIMQNYLEYGNKWGKIFVSGTDLNNSFIAMAERI